ncbi:hypothetical protein BCR26_08345 [Enterococcus rivorum]|uniref:Class C sortase n=1 Tax=Enterococcus rivorum TaxID=762845 RepID=A0A1E5L0M0_9ENTE|nr:hypothetical protein BCR26_08345 [Enterococcus rivorum]
MDLFFLVVTIAGIGLLLYPLFSDYQLKHSQTMAIQKYESRTGKLSEEEKKQKLKEYEEQNNEQQKGNAPLKDPFEKIEGKKGSNTLDLKEQSLPEPAAVLEIPKINLKVQVYPSSSDLALEEGIGVLEGTSLPTGGVGNHSVLTGHRGLSIGQMFTDLPNLKMKEHFYVTILDEVHAYEVDKIETVTPDNLTYFDRVPNEDYITLVTCTPLGINSHRLLVRGHRIPYVPEKKDPTNYWTMKTMLLIGLAITALLIILVLIIKKRRDKQKEKERRRQKQMQKKRKRKAGGKKREKQK